MHAGLQTNRYLGHDHRCGRKSSKEGVWAGHAAVQLLAPQTDWSWLVSPHLLVGRLCLSTSNAQRSPLNLQLEIKTRLISTNDRNQPKCNRHGRSQAHGLFRSPRLLRNWRGGTIPETAGRGGAGAWISNAVVCE